VMLVHVEVHLGAWYLGIYWLRLRNFIDDILWYMVYGMIETYHE
jgi:hypothetical protein